MKTKFKSDPFYAALLSLVLPITIQGLVNNAVNSADVFMLGYVGQDALSAVSLANQLQFVITGFFWGITGGTSLLIAQYFGKGDLRSVQMVMGIGFKVSLLFTLAVSLVAIFIPAPVMTLFTDDQTLITIGASYLRAIGVTYLLQAISQIYECAMRSMGRATVSTVISSVALFTNVGLNVVFIFGWLGFPRLGVLGVALATVIARTLEVALCVFDAGKSKFLRYEAALLLHSDTLLVKDFFRFSVPALLNDLSWTVAFSTYSVILGHLGSDVVAASAVATTVRDLCTVVCMSLGSAAVAILGKEIGAGRVDEAKRDGRRIVWLSFILGVLTGLVILLLRPALLILFPLTDTAQNYLSFMLLVSSYYVVGQSVNTAIITGVFRAGGDTKFGMLCDTINMWCLAVPIGFLAAFALKLPAKAVYFVLCLDEFYKIPVEIIHYRKYKWLRNVTR